MPTLSEIEIPFATDKGGLGYTDFYERHFKHLRRRRFDLLEVGTWRGDSLLMWAEWAPHARIVGVDICPQVRVDTPQVTTVIANVRDYTPDRAFDVIIDDASHQPGDVLAAFDRLWPHVTPGGFYAIEDMEVHSPQYPGPHKSGPLMDHLAAIVRGVCYGDGRGVFAVHGYPQRDVPSSSGVFAVFAYPRLVILEKES